MGAGWCCRRSRRLGFWRRSLKLLPELAARGGVTWAPVADLTSGPPDLRSLLVCDVAVEATVQLLYLWCLGKGVYCFVFVYGVLELSLARLQA